MEEEDLGLTEVDPGATVYRLVVSSFISHVGYDQANGWLTVYFLTHEKPAVYAGVGFADFRAMMEAPSKGVFFNRYVKNQFPQIY